MIELDEHDTQETRRPRRRSILRNTPALPVLVTLLNGISGFASIHYASRLGLGQASLQFLTVSAWLIFAAMVFDGLDGRLARLTRQATDFGAQLDSLCDAISFGVAPAMLMLQAVSKYLSGDIDIFHQQAPFLGKLFFAIAVLYMSCAILRLARFNTENAPDLLHHLHFKGLPSPGAAAAVAAIVLLFDEIQSFHTGWRAAPWLETAVFLALPVTTLAVGILMVSNFRYSHLVNQFVTGRKPFVYILKALLVIVAGIMFFQLAMALATIAYAVSGPIAAIFRKVRPAAVHATPHPKNPEPQ